MDDLYEYLIPEYYTDFHCKGGACRSTCCRGWSISLSMKEYFRLLGMDCSPELRRRLDSAFHIAQNPSEDRYAQITPNWQGDCPLRLPNGLCGLQCEYGEKSIPAICRLYPRGAHAAFQMECSCSGSCEGVMEMLLAMKEPMRFVKKKLAIVPEDLPIDRCDLRVRYYAQIRELIIGALQIRRYQICDRITLIGAMLERLHPAFMSGDEQQVQQAIEDCKDMTSPDRLDKDEKFAVYVQYRMSEMFGRYSMNVAPYADHAREVFGLTGDEIDGRTAAQAVEKYHAAAVHFEKIFPDWQRMFEQMLVNHVFFGRFPFSDQHESIKEEYLSLCAVYAFVRFLAVGWMADKEGVEPLADVCAAAFRLIDHSSFDRNAAALLESMGVRSAENMARLTLI